MIIKITTSIKHWHVTKKDSWFSHISIEGPGGETENVWLDPVIDEEYNKL